MCIIAIKVKGADFPPFDTIKTCTKTNPDGFAMAWNEDGRLRTYRTMDAADILAKYEEVSRLDPLATALIFHARIATHGSKRVENCHGWTDSRGRIAFFHNGVMRNVGSRDDLTDSETFFRDLFLPALDGVGMDYALKVAHLAASPSASKFALIDPDGHIYMTGDYQKTQFEGLRGKLYFSNSSYIPRSWYGSDSSAFYVASVLARRPDPKLPAWPQGNSAKSSAKGPVKRESKEKPSRSVRRAVAGLLFEDSL